MVTDSTTLRPGERVITEAKLSLGAVIVPAVVLLLGLILLFVNISEAVNQYRVLGHPDRGDRRVGPPPTR